jgi:hypothetical protein
MAPQILARKSYTTKCDIWYQQFILYIYIYFLIKGH